VAAICAAYVASVVTTIVVTMHLGGIGPRHALTGWQHRLGPLAVAAVIIASVGAVAVLIATAASKRLAGHVTREVQARPPKAREAAHLSSSVTSFALGVGIPTPDIVVVDDPTPNGFAVGRRHTRAVCVTTGALSPPHDQLDALCAQTLTALRHRALELTCAVADLVILAN